MSVTLKDVRHWVPAGGHKGSDYLLCATERPNGDIEATIIVASKPRNEREYTPACTSRRIDITFTAQQAIEFAQELLRPLGLDVATDYEMEVRGD